MIVLSPPHINSHAPLWYVDNYKSYYLARGQRTLKELLQQKCNTLKKTHEREGENKRGDSGGRGRGSGERQ